MAAHESLRTTKLYDRSKERLTLRRCVVPADGFFEWRGPKARREPLWIHPADDALLIFAGLFEAWQSQPGEWQTTFTIITTAANRTLEPIHSRMPVILDETGAADWMNLREPGPLSLKRLLVPAPDDLLLVRPASPLVNSVKNEAQSSWRICRYLANSGSEDALPAPALPNCWRWRRNRQLRECYITNTYANFDKAPVNPSLTLS